MATVRWRWSLSVGTTVAAGGAALAATWAAINAGSGQGGLHPMPRTIPFCTCEEDGPFAMDEGIARCQLASDFLIALAYFSIPLELVYFFLRAKVFPHRWVLLQFGLFIVLCGLTHVVNIWTYGPHPRSIALLQTILKVLTAAVSCATAFLLVTVIPALLNVKVRELFLQHKASQLDREMDVMKRREEAGRQVGLLTSRIRQTLDRHTILHTTMLDLSQALQLDNCTIWMPDARGRSLELAVEMQRRLVQVPVVVPLGEPTVQSIVKTNRALRISPSSPLGKASVLRTSTACTMAAIRIPILPLGDSLKDLGKGGSGGGSGGSGATQASLESNQMRFGIMVLVVCGDARRQWKSHEVEMMEVVADQVAIALCHAAVLEESQRRQEELMEKNYALDVARDRAEMAVAARNDFLTVMNHELRTPLHDIFGLVSLLQLEDEPLSREQRKMMGVVMRSSRLMCSMVTDVLAFSRMEENLLVAEYAPFDLHLVLRDVAQLSWPLAHSKRLTFVYNVAHDTPRWVVGDERRLMQMLLNVIGRAVECTPSGSVSVKVDVDKSKRVMPAAPQRQDYGMQQPWELAPSREAFVLSVEVTDTGAGHAEEEADGQFQPFGQTRNEAAGAGAGEGQGPGHPAPGTALPGPEAQNSGEGGGLSQSSAGSGGMLVVAQSGSGVYPGADGAFRGSGLGMAICQQFAQMMGGSVSIASAGRGRGSTVSFFVQLERDVVGAKRHQQQQEQQRVQGAEGPGSMDSVDGVEKEWELLDSYIGDLEGLHVMVVEDNPANKDTARLMLERLLCRVTAVETAGECLDWLSRAGASDAVDVVLIDVCLPGVDGFEIARRICQMFRADERPLLLGLTARTNTGVRDTCLRAGMDGVLFKPVTLLDLGSALCEVLTTGG